MHRVRRHATAPSPRVTQTDRAAVPRRCHHRVGAAAASAATAGQRRSSKWGGEQKSGCGSLPPQRLM